MISDDHSQTSNIQNRTGRKNLIALDLCDFEDANKSNAVRERLQKMELLARKLKVQLTMCASAVVLTTILYLTIWYNSDCWTLPFQKSVCKQTRDLPLMTTDRNTLADAVEEFVFALQTQIFKFHDVIELPLIADRQTMSNATKNEIGQLLYQHSADLIGFSAVKREDERLQELEFAIEYGYILILISSFISIIFMISVAIGAEYCKPPAIIKQEKSSPEEKENLQNTRLKQLKRRIPVLYIATYVCIATQLGFFFMFCAGQHTGNYPVFHDIKCFVNDTCAVQKNCALKISFSDYLSFATKLQTNLEKRLTKLDTSMESPLLEVRQLTYHYESEAIEMAIEHYLDLKQYNVDRRTMPRKIGNVLPNPSFCIPLIIGLPLNFIFFIVWAAAEGSVWQVFQFFRVDSTDNFKTDDDD